MINALKKLKTKEFTVSPDLEKHIYNSSYVSFARNKLTLTGGFVEGNITIPGTGFVQRYFKIDDRIFVSIENRIYELIDGTLNQVSVTRLYPFVSYVRVLYKGKEEIMFFNESTGIITGGEIPDIRIPPFDYYDVSNGRIFYGKDHRLYFTKDFDAKENSFDLKADYFLDLKKIYGKITGIKALKDKLYVFCENTVLCVVSDNSVLGLKLEETDFNGLKVRGFSVGKNNEKITFINYDQVCRFDGKKITETGIYITEEEDTFNLPKTEGKYYLKYIDEPFSKSCALIVDVEEPSFFRATLYDNFSIAQESMSAYKEESRKIATLEPSSMPPLNGYFSTKKIKLCDKKWVAVVGVSAEVKGRCTLRVCDGYNTTIYELSEEKNSIKCFHLTNEIDLSFNNFSQGFELKNLKITLRERK